MRLLKTLFVLCTAISLVGGVVPTAVSPIDGGRPYPMPPAAQSAILDGGRPYPMPPAMQLHVALLDGGRPYPMPPAGSAIPDGGRPYPMPPAIA
jgi:hypothetical protein